MSDIDYKTYIASFGKDSPFGNGMMDGFKRKSWFKTANGQRFLSECKSDLSKNHDLINMLLDHFGYHIVKSVCDQLQIVDSKRFEIVRKRNSSHESDNDHEFHRCYTCGGETSISNLLNTHNCLSTLDSRSYS
jgi:hypothetical protein